MDSLSLSTYVFYCSVSCSITQDVALGENPASLLGPRCFPMPRAIPEAGPLRTRHLRPRTGTLPLLLRALRTARFLPGLGLPIPPGKAEQEASLGDGRASPRSAVPLPSRVPRRSHRGGKEGGKDGHPPGAAPALGALTAPRQAGPAGTVPSRAEPGQAGPKHCPQLCLPCGSFPPGVPGAVSPPRRGPAATDGASARLETDSFCK